MIKNNRNSAYISKKYSDSINLFKNIEKILHNSSISSISSISLKVPVIILDLDGTILNNHSRQISILKKEIIPKFPDLMKYDIEDEITKLDGHYYSILSVIKEQGINKQLFSKIKQKFLYHFLSNDYLDKDEIFPGINHFIQKIHSLKIKLIYLTGRPRLMKDGTLSSLKKNKIFDICKFDELIMKDNKEIEDLEFKRKIFKEIRCNNQIQVVAIIDNEASVCKMANHYFPKSVIVQFRSNQSNDDEFKGLNLDSWNYF